MSRSSLFVIAVALLFAFNVLAHARRARTAERHTFGWLLVCCCVVALALWRGSIDSIAAALGVYYPPAALFFLAVAGLLWLLYRQSIQVSEVKGQLRQLAQEIALLNAKAPSRAGRD